MTSAEAKYTLKTTGHIAIGAVIRQEKDNMESRYYVFKLGGASPTKLHKTLESARQESRRLCELDKDAVFYVMRAVESVQYRTNPYQVTNYSKKEK